MKALVYIPYANGDPVHGFKYEGEPISEKKYIKMEEDEYYDNKDKVDYMVRNHLGDNMSINNFKKRKINVKKQTIVYHTCEGNIRNVNGKEITLDDLKEIFLAKQQSGLIVYLNEQEFKTKPDLETDLRMWIQDSQKIMDIPTISQAEKIYHLPKKDFRIDVEGQHMILQNCKFAQIKSSIMKANGEPLINAFSMIYERCIFLKNRVE